jgi:hypothetical protein
MSFNFTKRPSKKAVIITGAIATFLFFAGIGSANNNSEQNSAHTPPAAQTEQVKGAQTQKAPVIETKTVTETEAIPYNKTTQNDSTLESGKTALATTGVDGVKTITYQVTTTDGNETSRTKTSEEITTPAVDEVTKIGTKVAYTTPPVPSCPNGTYVNSVDNTVCSPYASSSIPAGATAQCRDGSYSFSQSRSGTCSHHGGVSIWY